MEKLHFSGTRLNQNLTVFVRVMVMSLQGIVVLHGRALLCFPSLLKQRAVLSGQAGFRGGTAEIQGQLWGCHKCTNVHVAYITVC